MLKRLSLCVALSVAGSVAITQEVQPAPSITATQPAQLRAELLAELESLNKIALRMQALKAYQEAFARRFSSAEHGVLTGTNFPDYLCAGEMENICKFLPITTGRLSVE